MSEIGACCWIRGLHSGDVGGSVVVLHSDGAGALHAAYPHLDDVDDDADLAVEAVGSARHRPSLSSVRMINQKMDLFCLFFISCYFILFPKLMP